jgi:glycosyltransferase involved in cell wall biosynthesis
MRILFVNTSMPPVPYGTGHQVHNWGNIQALQLLGHKVYLVMFSKFGDDGAAKIAEANSVNQNLELCTTIEVPEQRVRSLNTLSLSLVIKELTDSLINKKSYLVNNYQSVCLKFGEIIKDTEAEVIWYEDYHVAIFDNWISRNVPAIYNSHDNQAKLYKQKNLDNSQFSMNLGSQIRKIIYKRRHRILEEFEFKTQKKCNFMLTGNSQDAELSKSRGVNTILRTVPIIGAPVESLRCRINYINNKTIDQKIKLVHLGYLQGGFTSRSLIWFMDNVWNDLCHELQDVDFELHIIGGGKVSEQLRNKFLQKNIIYRGFVENLWDEFVDTFAMLIPGLISTGIRIRVPVAFSMMIPIIGNKISFDGMQNIKNGETILYAENGKDYAKSIRKLIDNDLLYKSICKKSRNVYDENFSIKSASVDIERVLSMLSL